ncbi:hypothetical protein PGB90_003022 [Kerria lacca]
MRTMMKFMVLVAILWILVIVDAASVDPEVSKAVEEAITSDEFVISMRNIRQLVSRRKKTETLFSLEFPGTHQKFSLQLDRDNKRVIANFKLHGESESRNFPLNNFTEDTALKTVLLSVRQSQPHAQLSLYIDCVSYGTIKTVKTFKDIYMNMRNPQILFYHERKYETDVDADTNIDDALLQNNCPTEIQAAQPATFRDSITADPYRGDIPSLSNDCSDLTCLDTPQGPKCGKCPAGYVGNGTHCKVTSRCSQNPCFQGVTCEDDENGGFRCGSCPRGFYGDGMICYNDLCALHPCYPGVACKNIENGYQCGSCPFGLTGDGRNCYQLCSYNSCAPGVSCENTPNGFKCSACPQGFTGNGINCRPLILPCDLKPCFRGVPCENTRDGGFICGPCPRNFTGNGVSCNEIFSKVLCPENACFQNVPCTMIDNIPRCGSCPVGYIGNGRNCEKKITCRDRPCHNNVECKDIPSGFKCGQCPAGYTGDGKTCEKIYTCDDQPCYPGVTCHNTANGPKCESCPEGYIGNGRSCVRTVTCKDQPCFPGVSCRDTKNGPQCGSCPPGYSGNGKNCSHIYSCQESPCFPGVLCTDTSEGPTCASCPAGFTGDGKKCVRFYSCQDLPCYPNVICTDTPRGPICGACPAGFTGNGIVCVKHYSCQDKPCFPGVQCTDTVEGPQCGLCPQGYKGNGKTCVWHYSCSYQPCYPGVKCSDTPEGPKCGPCPSNLVGDGQNCTKQITCVEEPCFPGVQCQDTAHGFVCGPCPTSMTGNGRYCKELKICGKANTCTPGTSCSEKFTHESGHKCEKICDDEEKCKEVNICDRNPCSPGTICLSINESPYYKCNQCPYGSISNGTTCSDVDECTVKPCFSKVRCINLIPGFRCDPCPPGFTGNMPEGIGVEYAVSNRQQCVDIDECSFNNGGCKGPCVNTPGSYYCQTCQTICGLQNITHNTVIRAAAITVTKVNQSESRFIFCPDGSQCNFNAECVKAEENNYKCKCREGWAGNGKECGRDTDLDGWPDNNLQCEENLCHQDNCIFIPNSGQEDKDNDGIGDKCDEDIDNDEIPNNLDNCIYVHNPDQKDSDRDGGDNVGDVCDNCPLIPNKDQKDTDKDGIGDACDNDLDNDGVANGKDNCVFIANSDQNDADQDGIGDACDNCPYISNINQEDRDNNGVGDTCDTNIDSDGDGKQDSTDNCPKHPNANQLDTDKDGIGDVCDDDIDGDGIENQFDNCPLRINPNQTDINRDGIGDICQGDYDGDDVINFLDNCPNNSKIFKTDFRTYQTVVLDPEGDSQIDPNWVILNQGAEIEQTMNSDPGLAVGYDAFGGVDFEGTFYVDTETDDDYIGFVFSYQSNSKFYAVMWKKNSQVYWQASPFRAYAEPGIHIKRVISATGPGQTLRNALWHTNDVDDQTKILWKDPKNIGWKEKVAYRWLLLHRPHIGLIRLRIFDGDNVISDSENIFDHTFRGGRLGVMCFSQEMIIWSRLIYRCNDKVPKLVYDELSQDLQKEVEIDDTVILSKN